MKENKFGNFLSKNSKKIFMTIICLILVLLLIHLYYRKIFEEGYFIQIVLLIITLFYALETSIIASKTGESVEATKKYIEVAENSIKTTKEIEIVERTINIIENFDSVRYKNLLNRKKNGSIPKYGLRLNPMIYKNMSDGYDEIDYFLNYFDNIAILYFLDKVDKEIFNLKVRNILVSFLFNLNEEIEDYIFSYGELNKKNNLFENFLKLSIKIMLEEKEIILNRNDISDKQYLKEIEEKIESIKLL